MIARSARPFPAARAIWPLVAIWLVVHAALLAVILGVKFLTVKTMALLLLAAAALWFLTGTRKRPALPAPPDMV